MKHYLIVLVMMTFLTVSVFGLTGYSKSQTLQMQTLPVELSSFTASVLFSGFVEILWVAETETGMLGYNVYRGIDNKLTEAANITVSIIPAHNSSITTAYNFIDEDVSKGNRYFYWLEAVNLDLSSSFYGPIAVELKEEGEEGGVVPVQFATALIGAYPNPFNISANIRFSLQHTETVTISIYNLKGQLISNLIIKETYDKGLHNALWNGTDNDGKDCHTGIYLCKLETSNNNVSIKKMLLLK